MKDNNRTSFTEKLDELFEEANSLFQSGNVETAETIYHQILECSPDHPRALHGLGVIAYQTRADAAAAIDMIRQALALDPHYVNALSNLGYILASESRLCEAEECYRRVIMHDPLHTEAHVKLGNLLKLQGRVVEGLEYYQKALVLQPDYHEVHSNCLMNLAYRSNANRSHLLRESGLWNKRHCLSPVNGRSHANSAIPARRLNIGYVSADFRTHPFGFFIKNILSHHDRDSYKVFCYTNSKINDSTTKLLRSFTDEWRDISDCTDDQAFHLIIGDAIDILVDLSGHTSGNRLKLFALRPAPLQVSWLGYYDTTGCSSIDYIIFDAVTVPLGEERYFSEKVLRLPDSRFCYAPPDYAPPVASPPVQSSGSITFGCFNNVAKITDDVVALWSDVLRAVPDSRILLKWKSFRDPDVRERYFDLFSRYGIPATRMDLRSDSRHDIMLAEYGEVDIALDTFPFSGGLTSCEALWMGVPIVTLTGDAPVSRQTRGFLKVLGMQELVAKSPEQYVAIAAELAADRERLARIRAGLRRRMAASPLCDGRKFTDNLEALFRDIWKLWCVQRNE